MGYRREDCQFQCYADAWDGVDQGPPWEGFYPHHHLAQEDFGKWLPDLDDERYASCMGICRELFDRLDAETSQKS